MFQSKVSRLRGVVGKVKRYTSLEVSDTRDRCTQKLGKFGIATSYEVPWLHLHHRPLALVSRVPVQNYSPPRPNIHSALQYRTMSSAPGNTTDRHRNRLGLEKSPYLLQHASNPVDWYPWGEEAFSKAKKENKPIFLSVGYSTCHWCHVMERESFENEAIGKFMSENFVNIKVDREERPDVDRVYMSFIHATTGHGGWPMSVWLTPDLKPIVGGTYFPPHDRYQGQPGFMSILKNVNARWTNAKDKLDQQGTVILDAMMRNEDSKKGNPDSVREIPAMLRCFILLQGNYDEDHGGFGEKPKFPQPVNFNFLLRMYAKNPSDLENKVALKMLTDTLLFMSKGGIRDHIYKGFHRYSTDQFWHVPHFEKMLYDQAQLAVVYSDAYQVTKDEDLAVVAHDILEYVDRDLSDPSGGFYSAEDADSLPTLESDKKQEGAFCVWTSSEIDSALSAPVPGQDTVTLADVFKFHFDVKVTGNVDPYQDPHDELKGKNVLIIRGSPASTADKFCLPLQETKEILEKCRKILFDIRKKRPPPHLDNKMLTAWNGLMISGFARAGQVFGEERYIERATRAANFIKDHMYDESTGLLLRTAYTDHDGSVSQIPSPIEGFVDDYAFLIRGLIDLYEGSFDENWLILAEKLQQKQNQLFWDQESGGYFATRADDKSILIRMKEDHDGAEPSGNSVSAMNLLRLSHFLHRAEWQQQAALLMATFSERLEKIPAALPEMVCAHMFLQSTAKQIIIAGDRGSEDTEALLSCVHSLYLPGKVLLLADGRQGSFLYERIPVLDSLEKVGGKATAYVCENYSCSLPVNSPEELRELLTKQE